MKYQIEGTPFPVLICTLNAKETVICETGAMLWMSSNMKMNTGTGGGIGKMFSRAISGESLFQSSYTAEGGEGLIAFGVNSPGEIIPLEIDASHSVIAQKGAFLASEETISSGITFQKKLGAGFFGGEGFILQKFTGKGHVFLAIDGGMISYDLASGEQLIIDTGAFAFAEETVRVDVQMVKGLGNIIAGGEGMFNTTLIGPGKVWLQTMPLSTTVQAIARFLPK
ncbi:MAG: TIGR00266 family protein [Spirochaetaceae bacterium]|jgi:uncharacterized protein (TIGR00266 family)|nr:TIGR00266 family protein [Spirochaetaceae bacterium]